MRSKSMLHIIHMIRTIHIILIITSGALILPASAQKKKATGGEKLIASAATPTPATASPAIPHEDTLSDAQPEKTIVLAVGKVTTLDFGSVKPVNIAAGERESLGLYKSDPDYPGFLIHFRPRAAGVNSNVIIETTEGKISFWVSTVASAQRGAFNEIVRIKMTKGGYESELQKARAELATSAASLKRAEEEKAIAVKDRDEATRRSEAARGEGRLQGIRDALTAFITQNTKAKGKAVAKDSIAAISLASAVPQGKGIFAVYEIENRSKRAIRLGAIERAIVSTDLTEISPRARSRVGVYVEGAGTELSFNFEGGNSLTTILR